jgi:hypothetical protein
MLVPRPEISAAEMQIAVVAPPELKLAVTLKLLPPVMLAAYQMLTSGALAGKGLLAGLLMTSVAPLE